MKNLIRILPPALLLGICTGVFSSVPSSTPPLSNEKSQEILFQASRALNEIAKKATPAVVSITSVREKDPSLADSLYFHDENSDSSEQAVMGIGSGVIIQAEGLILTNYHVIQNAEIVSVSLDEKHKFIAHVIGGDSKTDLALLRLDAPPQKNLPTLRFADSDLTQVGDWSVAIGSPFGLNRSVTSGIVSAVGRARLGMLDIEDFIQTDAAINPGSSGGPLLNMNGEMIGINTAIFSQSGGFIGIGFAIPSKIVKQVIQDLLKYGRVVRGWMGMSAQDLDHELAQYFNAPSIRGALISQIVPEGPAAKASLKTGDIITKFGETPIESADQLKTLVSKTKTNSQITIELLRDGSQHKISVMIREQIEPKRLHRKNQLAGKAYREKNSSSPPSFGLTVQDIPPEFLSLFGISKHSGAFVIDVKVGSPAFYAGITPGDIILNANHAEIHTAKDFLEMVQHSKKTEVTVLYVQKGPEEKIFVPLKTKLS